MTGHPSAAYFFPPIADLARFEWEDVLLQRTIKLTISIQINRMRVVA
jgi:hypothetical protein